MKKKKVSDLEEQIKSLKRENLELRMRSKIQEDENGVLVPKQPNFDYLKNLVTSLKTGKPDSTVNGLHYAILDNKSSHNFRNEEHVFNFDSYVKRKTKKLPLHKRLKHWYVTNKEIWKTKTYNWLYNALNKTRVSINDYLVNLSMNLFIHRHKDKIDEMMRVVENLEKRDRANIANYKLVGERDTVDTWEYKDYDGIVLHKEKN